MGASTKTLGAGSQGNLSSQVPWRDSGAAIADSADILSALSTSDDDAGYIYYAANVSVDASGQSYALTLTNFGFTIPAGSTSIYMQVTVRHRLSGTAQADKFYRVDDARVVVGGIPTGNNLAGPTNFSNTSYADLTLGSSTSDSTGVAPTVAQVNASDFGCRIYYDTDQDQFGTIRQIRLTYVSITLNYTDPANTRRRVTHMHIV